MKEKNKTIILVGGGTGGHIVPILNLYDELRRAKTKYNILVLGGDTVTDKKLYAGVDSFIALKTGKLHRALTLGNIVQFFYLLWGIYAAFVTLKKVKPTIIFSKAGYVSFPIILWAKILKIPYFIHESDIEMGMANKFAAKSANKIFVGFPEANYSAVPKHKLVFVGQMLKSGYTTDDSGFFNFGFAGDKPIIFVTGGSQGSRNINDAIFRSLNKLLKEYNIIHHTGSLDYKKAIEVRSQLDNGLKQSYFISPLLTKIAENIDMMRNAISQSQLVISRASATTLSEAASLKKPIIAIPYKYAASDHQTKNADYFKKHNAAIVISDDGLNVVSLVKQIKYLFDHKDKMKQMAQSAFTLTPKDGTTRIVKEIELFLSNEKYEEV